VVGIRQIRGSHSAQGGWGKVGQAVYNGGWHTPHRKREGYTDPDGLETVEDYLCADDCPVVDLDEQSITLGIHPAGNIGPMVNHKIGNTVYRGGWKPEQNNPDYYKNGHTGGASRFFKQVKSE